MTDETRLHVDEALIDKKMTIPGWYLLVGNIGHFEAVDTTRYRLPRVIRWLDNFNVRSNVRSNVRLVPDVYFSRRRSLRCLLSYVCSLTRYDSGDGG